MATAPHRGPVSRAHGLLRLLAAAALAVTPAVALGQHRDAGPAVEAATRFMLAWGHRDDAEWARTARDTVVVRIGRERWTLQRDAQTFPVMLVFPFSGLRPVWVGDELKGLTIESLCLSVSGRRHCGHGTVTLTRRDGTYRVIAVSLAAGGSSP